MKFFANMPLALKIGLLVGLVGLIVVVSVLLREHLLLVLVILAIGGVVAVGALLVYAMIKKRREKRQGDAFGEGLKQIARNNPQAVAADKARKARLDDLAHVFEEGVSKYRGAGKNLYSLPWYLLVGPPGSGKTEAMRHSSIGFPPGLQDPLQGTGGTLSMHWWFTNTAVVLDTAGRLFMSEGAGANDNSEWKEFLKILKRARPKCPVNGMLLAVDVETLLKDNAEQIEKKAGLIARQLDAIQRVLDVRFPVFVLVTKCDRIVGFREFFETMTDPQAAHQMLGWSNPADLDEPFSPDAIEQHLGVVREALVKRRRFLILDPVHTDDPSARRTDQVDSMFAFPDSLQAIGPRLRRFMELIFVAGEWSPKPLFLRGIYFTSSLQEGRSLDEALAKAMGCTLDELPGDAVPRKDKSFFLRDVFTGKVFREKGLVTNAANVSKSQRASRALLLGSGIAFAAVLIGLTFLGGWSLRETVTKPLSSWKSLARVYANVQDPASMTDSKNPVSIVKPGEGGRAYAGFDKIDDEIEEPRAELAIKSFEQMQNPLNPPLVFRPIAFLLGDSNTLSEERMAAHRAVVESSVLIPLVRAARESLAQRETWALASDPNATLTPAEAQRLDGLRKHREEIAVKALAQLVRLDTLAAGEVPVSMKDTKGKGTPLMDVGALITLVELRAPGATIEKPTERKNQIEAIQAVIDETYTKDGVVIKDAWPPATLRASDEASRAELAKSIDLFAESSRKVEGRGEFGAIVDLFVGLAEFQEADKASVRWPSDAGTPDTQRTLDQFDGAMRQWETAGEKIQPAAKRVEGAMARVAKRAIDATFLDEVARAETQRIERDFGTIVNELPEQASGGAGGLLDKLASRAEKEAEKRAEGRAASSVGSGAAGDVKASARAAASGSSKDTLASRLSTNKKGAMDEVAALLKRFKELLNTKESSVLLARAGGDEARIVKRVQAYAMATKELRDAKIESESFKPGDGQSLADAVRRSDESREKAITQITQWDVDANGAAPGLTSKPSLENALTAARAARVGRLLDSYIGNRLQGGGSGWTELARRIPSSAESEAALPKIAVLDPTQVLDERYRPAAAKIIFGDYQAAFDEVNSQSTRLERPLNNAALKGRVGDVRDSLRAYSDAYFKYWSEDVRGAWLSKKFTSWTKYREALDDPSLTNAGEGVAAFLREQVERAFTAIPSAAAGASEAQTLINPKALGDARKRVAEEAEALRVAATRSRMASALNEWRKLPADSGRNALEAMLQTGGNPEDVEQTYFGHVRTPAVPSAPSEFWTSVWLEGVRLLAKEREEAAGTMQEELRRLLGGFPIALDGGNVLTREEVKRASQLVGGAIGRPLDKALVVPVVSQSQIQTLQDVNRSMMTSALPGGAAAERKLQPMRAVAQKLATPSGVSVEFAILNGAPSGRPTGALAVYTFKVANVLVNGTAQSVPGRAGTGWTNVADLTSFPFEASVGLSDVSVQMALSEDEKAPQITFTVAKPWNLLLGMRQKSERAASEADAGRTVWLLPLTGTDAGGKEFVLWVKMREKATPGTLPALDAWPTTRDLP